MSNLTVDERQELINRKAQELADVIESFSSPVIRNLPREQAIIKLEECTFWAVKSISQKWTKTSEDPGVIVSSGKCANDE